MTGFDILHAVAEAGSPAGYTDVYIEVGVEPAQLAPVRVVAADLAARVDFDLDAVSDLRMAVDEACATLATLAWPGTRLRCRLQAHPDRITVTVRIPDPGTSISQVSFGWRVLATLTDEVGVLEEDDDGAAALGIRLVKRRCPA